jgi:hypothetical protein
LKNLLDQGIMGKLRRISLPSIDYTDETYRTSYGRDLQDLIRSIQASGLFNPPVLERLGKGRFRIFSGFRRVAALMMLEVKNTKALVVEGPLPWPESLYWIIRENLSHRSLNLVEKAKVVVRLSSQGPKDQVFGVLFPLLGLKGRENLLVRLKGIAALDPPFQDALLSGRLKEEAALRLLEFSPKDRVILLELFDGLPMSFQDQAECLTWIREILARDHQSLDNFSGEIPFKKWEKTSPQEKARAFKSIVRQRRFPQLTALEEDFKNRLKKAALGTEIQVSPPPYFEGGRYGFNFHVKNKNELISIINKLKELSKVLYE